MLIQPACLVGMSSRRPGVYSAVHMVVHMTYHALTSMHSDQVYLHGGLHAMVFMGQIYLSTGMLGVLSQGQLHRA